MLEVTYHYGLIAASLAVAMMAGFTGFSLMRGASSLSIDRRKQVTAYASVALGGGIWSMHFVAMLGMQLPIQFYYDSLITLISALIAILVVGLALLLLHFRPRTSRTKFVAGTIIGFGILMMHYTGMSGIENCIPLYNPIGVITAVCASILLSIGAIWVAYRERTRRNILLGTLCFGFSVFSVHFVAMAGTSFLPAEAEGNMTFPIGNDTLAIIVTLGAFLICGAFLLNSFTFNQVVQSPQSRDDSRVAPVREGAPAQLAEFSGNLDRHAQQETAEQLPTRSQIPYEKNSRIHFIPTLDVAALRAEGHYSYLYTREEKLFCPWSISEAERRLPKDLFIKTHRSFLVNPNHVSSFERKKDNGACFFDGIDSLEKVPVSRSRLPVIRRALGF